MSWRFDTLVREANKNVFSPRAPMFIILIASVVAAAGGPALAAWEAHRFAVALDGLNERGRNVITYGAASPDDPTRITRASCERLVREPDVARAGLVLTDGEAESAQIGSKVTRIRASVTLVPELRDADVLIGASMPAAKDWSTRLVTVDGEVLRASVGSAQPAGVRVNRSVTMPLRPEVREADQCIAVLSPLAEPERVAPRLASALQTVGGAVTGRPELRESTSVVSGFRQRLTSVAAPAVGVFGAALTGVVLRLRRREFAAYRLSGSGRAAILHLVVLEQLLIAAMSVLVGAAMVAGLDTNPLSRETFGLATLAQATIWGMVSVFMAVASTVRNPARTVRGD